jgi:hypothetical protein
MFEIFDPFTGRIVLTVKRQVTAKVICRMVALRKGMFLDYARPGEGYC